MNAIIGWFMRLVARVYADLYRLFPLFKIKLLANFFFYWSAMSEARRCEFCHRQWSLADWFNSSRVGMVGAKELAHRRCFHLTERLVQYETLAD